MTIIIAVANHKGGSGKTTSAYYLGLALATQGLDTLLVDLDDQATLTARLAVKSPASAACRTIADVLDGAPLREAVTACTSRLSYIASDYRLAWIAAKLQASSPNHAYLRRALDRSSLLEDIDIILLDCPPSAGVVMINALAAADYVVIPTTPTVESYQGLQRMQLMVAELGDVLNHKVTTLGNIITMESASSISERQYHELLVTDSLGVVPRRVGADADRALAMAYEPIAANLIYEVQKCCAN